MRLCKRCSKEKDLNEFPKNKNKHLGHGHTCKVCSKKIIEDYYKTPEGIVTAIYNGQKRSAKYRGMELPTYSKDELKEWLFAKHEFYIMFRKWTHKDCLKDLKPSVDRVDDYKSYTIENIQLMTWKENREKLHQDKINGINNKQSKAVVATIKGTDKSAVYYSIAEASRVLNIDSKNIVYCCQNKPKYNSAGGYTWKYLTLDQ